MIVLVWRKGRLSLVIIFFSLMGPWWVLWVLTGGSSCDDRVRRLGVRSLLVVVSH